MPMSEAPVLQRVSDLRQRCVKLRGDAWNLTGDKFLDDRLQAACIAFLQIEDHYRETATTVRRKED